MKRLAVLGSPVAHSRSPAMHGAALAELGLNGSWSYEAIEVSAEELPGLLERLPWDGFVGVNVTIPHKSAALALADECSPAAAAIGAANTLSFGPDGIRAENTDAPGLLAALPAAPAGRRALVLGAGGAGRAAVWALLSAGAEVTVWNRTAERAARVASELGARALEPGASPAPEEYEILVNTTSVGLGTLDPPAKSPATFKLLGFGADQLTDRLVVVDLAYGEAETELVKVARERGAEAIDGLEVLVRQGAESLRIWTGLDPPLEAIRRGARQQQQR